jgi:hypothetical protein
MSWLDFRCAAQGLPRIGYRVALLKRKPVAKPNYSYEKRQRELEKKKKKEEKAARKAAGGTDHEHMSDAQAPHLASDGAPQDTPTASTVPTEPDQPPSAS